MDEMEEQIQRIENKLQLLLKEYNAGQKEIQRLQKENKRFSEQLNVYEAQTEHRRLGTAGKLTSKNLNDHSKKDLEKRIDTYLKDIEKCLELLHS